MLFGVGSDGVETDRVFLTFGGQSARARAYKYQCLNVTYGVILILNPTKYERRFTD